MSELPHDPAVPIDRQPAIARWELWSAATMLVVTHGDDAEAHAAERLRDAEARDHEGDALVWQGVLTQLEGIRQARAPKLDAVYFIAGEDSADDPAWGMDPLTTGTPDEVRAWLVAQSGLDTLSVVRADGSAAWARDYLAAGAAQESRSAPGG